MATTISSTTLSVAISDDTTRQITPASMTGIVVGDILFVGNEAMVVQEVLTSTVKVQRGQAGTRATDHEAGDRMWHGPTRQFQAKDPHDIESAGDTEFTPWINVHSGGVFVLNDNNQWIRAHDRGVVTRPVRTLSADGAIALEEGITILEGSDTAYTLAAPASDMDGMRLWIFANAATAFVITATNLLRGDSAGTDDDTATFGGAIGDHVELVAFDGVWLFKSSKNITFA